MPIEKYFTYMLNIRIKTLSLPRIQKRQKDERSNIFAVIAEVIMYLTAMLDGKYALTEATYNSHINSLASALMIINIATMGFLIWIVKH